MIETDDNAPVRLARRVAELTGCSRREAAHYIEGGWVTVDGDVVESPQQEIDTQVVAVLPGAIAETPEPATFVLHKPADTDTRDAIALVSADNRIDDDPSRIRVLQRHFARRNAPLPLEALASGLVVVTQDAKLVHRLEEDAARLEHEFNVDVEGDIAMYGLARLNHGLGDLSSVPLPTAKASWQSERRLRLAMKAPRPGQIEAMCAAVGLRATAIKRIRVGRIALAKLPIGRWRYLAHHERF
ncbi:MAG: RNA pseudouridine synthase [Luteimonas sp.]